MEGSGLSNLVGRPLFDAPRFSSYTSMVRGMLPGVRWLGGRAVIFNVAQLLKAAVGTTREYDVDERIPVLDEQIELTEPVRGRVRLVRTNRGILVNARLQTSVRLTCSRCLDLYVEGLPIRFTEEYIPVIDVVSGLPTHIPHESYAFLISERHELDLRPAVREYGVLEIPMKPLCSSNCKGLCPQCGAKLGEQACTCVVEVQDARLAALRALLEETEEAGP